MSAPAPRMSIGMPVWNGERFITEALDSLLAQDLEDFELVISDNASEDATEEICRAYERRDPRIRYHRNASNIGAAANFNLVFRMARARHFMWAAYDDRWEPPYVRRCLEVLDEDPTAVLCYARVNMLQEDGAPIGIYEDPLGEVGATDPADRFRRILWRMDRCHAVFGVMRSEALAATNGLGRNLGSDRVLLAELALLGRFRQVPEVLFHNRLTMTVRSARDRLWWDPRNRFRPTFRMFRLVAGHVRALRAAEVPAVRTAGLALQTVARFGWWDVRRAKRKTQAMLKRLVRRSRSEGASSGGGSAGPAR